MRVVLVDNLLFESRGGKVRLDLQPHIGLISLIGALNDSGHEGLLFDPKLYLRDQPTCLVEGLYALLARAIASLSPDIVGFTSLGCNFLCTVKIAENLRRQAPEIPIILGGPHATILSKEILASLPQFDVVVRHEAELVIVPLVQSIGTPSALANVPSIAYRVGANVVQTPALGSIEDLDRLPWPAFESYPIREIGLQSIRVEAGRGCPFECTFCSTAEFFGRRYRLKSAGRLREELTYLNAVYGIRDFSLTHDLFTVDKRKVRAFCEEVAPLGFTWSCSARMDCVDPSLLAQMAAAGCRSIYYGIETGSPRLQRLVKKRQDLSMFPEILKATIAVGIAPTVSFIVGYPDETKEDQAATLNLVGSTFLLPDAQVLAQLHLLTPEPGTEMIRVHKARLRFDGFVSDFLFPFLEADDLAFVNSHPELFPNHFYYETALPRSCHVFASTAFDYINSIHWALRRELLRLYSDSLSDLVDELREAAGSTGEHMRFHPSLVEQVAASRSGVQDSLVPLLKYWRLIETAPSRATEGDPQRREAVNTQQSFVLRTGAAVLRGVPDCHLLLDKLSAGRALADTPLEVGDFVVVVSYEPDRMVRQYLVEEHMLAACVFFQTPRTVEDFNREFGELVEDPIEAFELLRDSVLEVASP